MDLGLTFIHLGDPAPGPYLLHIPDTNFTEQVAALSAAFCLFPYSFCATFLSLE